MKREYVKDWFSEDGAEYKIEVAILKDIVILTLDTSGPGLHKRGYRENAGEAPLKETLAAALVLLSKWEPSRILSDPMCGSGTIAIEAALIGKNIAPGLNRSFAAEAWDIIPLNMWEEVRKHARNSINKENFRILASDINGRILKTARDNAEKAGVSDYIAFQKMSMEEFKSKKKYGFIITNPPYGERLNTLKEVEKLYKNLGVVYSDLQDWSCFVLTSYEGFEKIFGKKSDKNRKLYNGRLKCYYYQYIGLEPPKKHYEK